MPRNHESIGVIYFTIEEQFLYDPIMGVIISNQRVNKIFSNASPGLTVRSSGC